MKNRHSYVILGIVLLTVFSSCSTVRHLPDGQVLYLGTRSVRYYSVPDHASDSAAQKPVKEKPVKEKMERSIPVVKTLWEKPNGALLGMPFIRFIPFRLYFYNWFYTEEDSTFSSWMMRNFGEPPRTIREVNPEARVLLIENELFNQGYFGVSGSYDLKYKKNGKDNKAWLRYTFIMPEAYTFREIRLHLDSGQLDFSAPLENYLKTSLLLSGEKFNLDRISKDKDLLWQYMQNQGYYHLKKDHILLIADTTVGHRQVDMEYRIRKEAPAAILQQVSIGEKHFQIDSTLRVKPRLLEESIPIEKDSLYRLRNTKKAYRNISSMGIFADPVISYETVPGDSGRVVSHIKLNATDLFSVGTNTNMTIKNTGTIGPNLGIFATQKNLFGGAENLTLALEGYMDFPYGVMSDRVSRSSGFTASATLSTPILWSPHPIARNASGIPRRVIGVSMELNHRKDFFKIIEWKTSYGISWHRNPRINHQINLVNLNYARLIDSTKQFQDLINESALVEQSYRSQFILGPSYAFTYNNTLDQSRRFRTYYRAEVETAGNLLQGAYALAGKDGKEQTVLGVPFSQYVRLSSDFRAYYQLGQRKSTLLAYRNSLGWGHAYGNSHAVPYTRQFFIGGSNSLRPITARAVGPGSYLETDEAAYNQVGDVKIENNLEFRFKIFYIFHGALWSDVGNIWLLKEDPERPGSGIRWGKLFRDSYLTSGIGLRVDLSFLVVRADYGAILHMPSLPDGQRWLWNNKLPLHGLVFGIGYPF